MKAVSIERCKAIKRINTHSGGQASFVLGDFTPKTKPISILKTQYLYYRHPLSIYTGLSSQASGQNSFNGSQNADFVSFSEKVAHKVAHSNPAMAFSG